MVCQRTGARSCRRARCSGLSVLILSLVVPALSHAQWQPDGTALGSFGGFQGWPQVVADGAGGVIVAWTDTRSGVSDIYAQRMDAAGRALWTSGGVPLCTATGYQYVDGIVSDGSGGAIVFWDDVRTGTNDIYCRRVSASGTPLWTPDGVALCTFANYQYGCGIISDGAGGAIVVWQDNRSGSNADVYARRVTASGTASWTPDGVAICSLSSNQYSPRIATDAAGGAIIAWTDYRSGITDIYAQRVGGAGNVLWAPNGVAVCTATDAQDYPQVTSDAAGGAIVVWSDGRSGVNLDIFAQRLDPTGLPRWAADGITVCVAAGSQTLYTIAADGFGGAILGWLDLRAVSYDIYAQRVNGSGVALWTGDGVPVCTVPSSEYNVVAVSDDLGGATLAWTDNRGPSGDIYAQRVSAAGAIQWAANGVPLCAAANSQGYVGLASDGFGNAVAAWEDWRQGSATSVYMQRIEGRYGAWGHPEPTVASVADVSQDQGGRVAVNWTASGRDLPVPRTIGYYSVWRAVDALPAAAVGHTLTSLSGVSPSGLRSDGPVYLALSSPPTYYWELAGTQDAQGWPAYSFSTPTRADSVAGDPGTEFFMVAAHDKDDSYVAFASNVLSGHSTDNLAPAPPGLLTAQRVGADVHLRWDRVAAADLRDYAVYRADASGVTPIPVNFLAGSADTVLVDAGAPSSALYYIATAIDVHANQSPASNEASVSSITGIADLPSGVKLAVLPNRPNPFATTTQFHMGLAERCDVVIEIFDVGGRLIRRLTQDAAGPGWVRVPFDGRDDSGRPLASGVSFYRVSANGTAVTRKMVIAR